MTKPANDFLDEMVVNLASSGDLGDFEASTDHGHHGGATHHSGEASGHHGGTSGNSGGSGHPGTTTTVRTAVHGGHEIKIETTYRITIDGVPLTGHVEVLDDGRVHYHGLPNYAVPSMVGLMRLVVDHFGTEPPAVDELGE